MDSNSWPTEASTPRSEIKDAKPESTVFADEAAYDKE